jgi:7-carboxy-7-deazaguanine synthase
MSGTTYAVNDLYPTIQGEGSLTGTPMLLLRLQGCGVGCPWCDTKETWAHRPADTQVGTLLDATTDPRNWAEMTPAAIAQEVSAMGLGERWVLLTGGEPAEQPLAPLVSALQEHGYDVALETSGTAIGHLGAKIDWVCVSPKVGMPGGKKILPEALTVADEIKFVVGKAADIERFKSFLTDYDRSIPADALRTVQPLSQNKTATELCVKACREYGWRLSLQTHKYMAVR